MAARFKVPVLVIATSLMLASCAELPEAPGPYPSNFVPAHSLSDDSLPGALSPYGFDEAQRMTVRVRNIGCAKISTGTGFAIDDYTLVTNRHVIENAQSLQIDTYDGRSIDTKAASSTTVADIAIITTVDPIGAFSTLADSDPREGDAITIVGYPSGGPMSTSAGVVLGSTSDPLGGTLGTVLASSASVEHGSSGSPVLDSEGRVVGVVYAKNDADQSFFVPVSTLRTLLAESSLQVLQPPACG